MFANMETAFTAFCHDFIRIFVDSPKSTVPFMKNLFSFVLILENIKIKIHITVILKM